MSCRLSERFTSAAIGACAGPIAVVLMPQVGNSAGGMVSALVVGGMVGGVCRNLGAAVVGLFCGTMIGIVVSPLGRAISATLAVLGSCGLFLVLLRRIGSLRQQPIPTPGMDGPGAGGDRVIWSPGCSPPRLSIKRKPSG